MKRRISFSLDEETIEQCDRAAKDLGLSRSAYVSFLINSIDRVVHESRYSSVDVAEDLADRTGKTLEIPQ